MEGALIYNLQAVGVWGIFTVRKVLQNIVYPFNHE